MGSLILLLFYSSILLAQNDKREVRETKNFLQYVRDSVFSQKRYMLLENKDHVLIRNYLWNKSLFGGVALAVISSNFLTSEEINYAYNKMNDDTSKYYLPTNYIKHSKLVTETTDCILLSKPIFIRKYKYCIFSWGTRESNVTLFFKKGKQSWEIVRLIGEIRDI